MKILGLLVCVLGWFIAVLSVKVPGVYAQLLVAAAGFVVAADRGSWNSQQRAPQRRDLESLKGKLRC